jgi:hypothetical protein
VVRTNERTSLKTVTSVCLHSPFDFESSVNRLSAYPGEAGEGEWNHTNPATSAATTSAAIQAVAQFTSPPEGYYPYFYPPPGFIPPGHEGQPGPDGGPSANGQPQPVFYVHPNGYPYSHFPHPGATPYAPHAQPPQTLNPSESTKKHDEARATEQSDGATAAPPKKKARTAKNGEPKAKKSKGAGGRSQKGKKVNGAGASAATAMEGHESDGHV